MKKFFLLTTILLVICLLLPQYAYARSGCCSYHGGVCGCGCCDGTSLSSTCAPYYPWCNGGSSNTVTNYYPTLSLVPTNPTSGTQNYSPSSDNWCNYDVVANWSGAGTATGYSVALTKIAGGNPGSLIDTADTNYTFKNIPYGTWYLNIRAHNSYGWASNITYWTLSVPKLIPTFNVSLNGEQIDYDFSCMKQITAPEFFINTMKFSGNSPKSSIKIAEPLQTQTLSFTATDYSGKKYEKSLTYSPATPTPAPSPSFPTGKIFGWVIIGGIIIFMIRIFKK